MYGAIQASCRLSQAAAAHLNEHCDTMDGILVWIDVIKTNDNEGYVEIHVATLTAKATKRYMGGYPGGLLTYIRHIQEGYAGLKSLGSKYEYKDQQKYSILLSNLDFDHQDQYLLTHCRQECNTYEQCIQYLTKEAITRKNSNITEASCRVKTTQHGTQNDLVSQIMSSMRSTNPATPNNAERRVQQTELHNLEMDRIDRVINQVGLTNEWSEQIRSAYLASRDP